jgi:aquaporin Z
MIARSCISGYPSPDNSVSFLTAFLVETIFTFGLVLVYLNVAESDANAGNSFYGLAIGHTVTFGVIAGGGISGGAFNPVVGFALPIVHGVTDDIPLYLLGPFVGATFAASFFMFTAKRSEFMEKEIKKE